MPNKDSLSSGFVGEDIPSQESMFSNISEFYRSESGYSCLHLCRRYGKLHILKSLQPPFKQEEFYKQLLPKDSISATSWITRISCHIDRLGTTRGLGVMYRDGIR